MKKLTAFFLFLSSFNALSDPIGKYICSAEDEILSQYSAIVDLDKNEIKTIKDGLNPNDPTLWKSIYSLNDHAYCGYSPAVFNNISCSFNTQHDSTTGYTSKDLLCLRNYPDGSTSTLTTGSLYLNTKQLEGGLRCSVRNIPSRSLRFFDCKLLSKN